MKLVVMLAVVWWAAEAHELVYVAQMVSVGARFPRYVVGEWAGPSGTLTHVGKRQLYLLGRETRKEYIEKHKFLSENYNPLKHSIKAGFGFSDSEPASASAFLKGLYVTGSGKALTRWQQKRAVPPGPYSGFAPLQKDLRDAALPSYFASVPAMVESGGPDYLFAAPKHCDNIPYLANDYLGTNSTLADRIAKKEKIYRVGVYKELKEKFGVDVDMGKALEIRDYIVSAEYYAYKLKQSITPESLKQLEEINSLKKYEIELGEKNVSRVISYGLLLELNRTLPLIKNNLEHELMTTFVVDEMNLMALLRLLGVGSEKSKVGFASSLSIEVHAGKDSRHVAVKHNGELVKKMELDEFITFCRGNILEEFLDYCVRDKTKDIKYGVPWVSGIVMGATVIVIVATIVIVIRINRQDSAKKREEDERTASAGENTKT